jgi:pantothenate kinase type III
LNSRRLAVNIGNTRIAAALCEGLSVGTTRHFLLEEYSSVAEYVAEELQHGITEVALCSVVPMVRKQLVSELGKAGINIFEVQAESQDILTGLYAGIGADRVANAAAAYELYSQKAPVNSSVDAQTNAPIKPSGDRPNNAPVKPSEENNALTNNPIKAPLKSAVLVLDFGTATTMTAVSASGVFEGGLITLGLGKTFSALAQSTAQLPNMHFEFLERDITPLAHDTETSIASGAVLAHVGLVKHWIGAAKSKLAGKAIVVATGGYSENLRAFLADSVEIFDQQLTLKGINLIAASAASKPSKAP